MIADFYQNNKRVVQIAGVIILLFIAGILFALFLPSRGTVQEELGEQKVGKQAPLFSDLRLGTPVRASFATQKNPPIKQKTEYTVNEQIMLQGTTTAAATGPVEITVRLVDEKSSIISMNPSKVTLDKGTNSYCCWDIKTPGQYTMQVFRPDSVVTRLPIKIVKDFESQTVNK